MLVVTAVLSPRSRRSSRKSPSIRRQLQEYRRGGRVLREERRGPGHQARAASPRVLSFDRDGRVSDREGAVGCLATAPVVRGERRRPRRTAPSLVPRRRHQRVASDDNDPQLRCTDARSYRSPAVAAWAHQSLDAACGSHGWSSTQSAGGGSRCDVLAVRGTRRARSVHHWCDRRQRRPWAGVDNARSPARDFFPSALLGALASGPELEAACRPRTIGCAHRRSER